MRLVSKSEFARERSVHPSRVSQWLRQNRIAEVAGKIDADDAHGRLNLTLDQAMGMRRGGNITSSGPAAVTPPAAIEPPAPPAKEEPASSPRDDSGYWASKARREEAEATLSELRAKQAAGALTSAAAVERAAKETARRFRNLLQAQPDDLAQILDPGNPARAHKLLTDYNNRLLREFRIELEQRGAAAARADERDPALL